MSSDGVKSWPFTEYCFINWAKNIYNSFFDFHKKLSPELQQRDLTDLLPEVEEYTINTLLPALAKGGSLAEQQRQEVARQISQYAGISEEVVLQHNLRVPKQFFWKELLWDEGYIIGRLDSRYLGIDKL